MNDSRAYDTNFYALNLVSQNSTASSLVAAIKKWVSPNSVIDIGCGVGLILLQWLKHGVEDIIGVDGEYVDRNLLALPNECFIPHDLTKPFPITRRFDIAMCLEVAEHLPQNHETALIRLLCDLSDIVAFSAAIPTQGSNSHVNEHYQSYWETLFHKNGYIAVDCIRPAIWNINSIDYIYRQNLILYIKSEKLADYPALYEYHKAHPDNVMDMVHPFLWEYYQNIIKLNAAWYYAPKIQKIRDAAKKRQIVCWGTGFNANCLRFYFAEANFAPDMIFVDGLKTIPTLKEMPITPLDRLEGKAGSYYIVISTSIHHSDIIEKLKTMGYGNNDYCWFIE